MTPGNVGADELKAAWEKYEKNLLKLKKRSINVIDILATMSTATADAEKSKMVTLPGTV